MQLIGDQFGHFKVIAKSPSWKHRTGTRWECKCVCGKSVVVLGDKLVSGRVQSCGCSPQINPILGKTGTRYYQIWVQMKDRCGNPENQQFQRYGGRGITVCQQWLDSFEVFKRDMGARPHGKTLDRIDNDSGYRPDNCRWATKVQQNRNRRSLKGKPRILKTVTLDGKVLRWKDVSKRATKAGVNRLMFWYRVDEGWPEHRLFIPVGSDDLKKRTKRTVIELAEKDVTP